MHRPRIDQLVYSVLFPHPVQGRDPPTFQAHITKNLVPEVREEIKCFYGDIPSIESEYPGLDYAYRGHRLRLGRFTFHRRLFRAFDALRLTETEIHNLCHWEGTKWAKDRYEKAEGVMIRDTTWDDIAPYAPRQRRVVSKDSGEPAEEGTATEYETYSAEEDEDVEDEEGQEEGDDDEEDEEDSEDEVLNQSVGVELNRRLLAAAEARIRGEDVALDADWEQWLKEAAERGFVPDASPLNRPEPEQSNSGPGQTQWGQTIPEIFRYGPGQPVSPHVEMMRQRMAPPPVWPSGTSIPSISSWFTLANPDGSLM
ncbi:hypothetical protein MMC30_003163 [Trapelia coarctata]|nr:hypothetical protein [Trapelia coarctata]